MGRRYAGILGPLAFALMLVRGLLNGGGAEPTLWAASCGMFGFAFLGLILGETADYLVRESVKARFQQAVMQWEADQQRTESQA
jgi:hypothetical protein